jgi:molybdopterin-guanine dinucleotide biosynthesis protein A
VAEAFNTSPPTIDGWVLSGGQGSRMGGVDKGLLPWQGLPLAWHVAQRLEPQVRQVQVNANRHMSQYAA